jgi:prepilin-type processing-associated H-X9-DG protein
MEQPALWDEWNTRFLDDSGNPIAPSAPSIEGLTCPSNPPEIPGQPWLAYVGNAGWAFSDSTRSGDEFEYAANGVFFDDNQNPNFGPPDGREAHPRLKMSFAQVTDGTSKTLMLSENMHTIYWTYGIEQQPGSSGYFQPVDADIRDAKHLFGFVWKNQPTQIERINGDKFYDQAPSPVDVNPSNPMLEYVKPQYETYGYPSSNHPGGVNVAFCGGQVEFMAESIDPLVYGQLMTSNSKRSKLIGPNNTPDRKLPQPSDDQY